MNHGPDESTRPGQCPLCHSTVPAPADPRSPSEVMAVLARHFEDACAAISFPLPAHPAR